MKRTLYSLGLIVSLLTSTNINAQPFPLDSTFAMNGFNIVNMNSTAYGMIKVANQSNGKIVVCASKSSGPDAYDFSVVRFNADGKTDSTFGTNGVAIKDVNTYDYAQNICVQNDDKIIVVGASTRTGDRSLTMLRFNPDGIIDQAFGNNGVVTLSVMYDDTFFAVHQQSDGKILAAGTANDLGYICRFLENGTPDNTFGSNGSVSFSVGQTTIINNIATVGENDIYVAGQIAGFTADGFVTKLHLNGSINTAFGINGTYYVDFLSQEYVNAMVCQPDGKILVGGAYGTMVGSNPLAELMVLRLTPEGTLDQSFNNTGKLTFVFEPNTENICHSLVLMPSGEIFASGYSGDITTSYTKLSIAKIKPNGSLDSTFAFNGKLVTDFGSPYEKAHGAILTSDNKLVVSGYSGNNVKPMVCRFLTTPNPAFEQKILEEGNTWNVLAVEYIPGDPYYDTTFHTVTYRIFSDTVINTVAYKNIMSSTEKNPASWKHAGYIREDYNLRVWMRETANGEEYLLYDFSAGVGEEMMIGLNQPVPLTVDSIKEVDLDGIIRLKFWLSYNDYHETWLTGIGSNKGICFSGSANITGGWYWLLCMSDINGPVYSNPDFESCYLVTNTQNLVSKNFTLYPNPASNIITFSFPASFILTESEVAIFNIAGHLIENKKITGHDFHYNVAHLKEGIYYCRIKSPEYIHTEKLVITR